MYTSVGDGTEIEVKSGVPGADDDSSASPTDPDDSVNYSLDGDDPSIGS